MKSTRKWLGLFTALLLASGCATNTSPTQLTINTADEGRSAEREEPVEEGLSEDASDVLTALAVLHSEVVALRREVAALERGEASEVTHETGERVAARAAISDGEVAPATFEPPDQITELPPAKTHLKADCDTDARGILEQAITTQKTALRTIANNLANVNTAGFKRDRVNFEDVGYRRQALPSVQDSR